MPRFTVADVSQNPLQPPTGPLSLGMLLERGLLRAGLTNFIYLHVFFFHFSHPLDLNISGNIGVSLHQTRVDMRLKGPLATSTFGDVFRVPHTAKDVVPYGTEAAQCLRTAQDCRPNTAATKQLPRDIGGDTPLPPSRSPIMRTWMLCNISFPPGPPNSDSSETGQAIRRLHALPCPVSFGGASPGSGVAGAAVDMHGRGGDGASCGLHFLEALGSHVFRAKGDS